MTAKLVSNDGSSALIVEILGAGEYAHEAGFEGKLEIYGSHWDGDHTFPFSTSIEGLWLRSSSLGEMSDHIAIWTKLPLDALATEKLDGEFELARLPGQSVRVRFGSRTDTISERKPIISVHLCAGRLSCDSHFVTDQSCLGSFADELHRHLHAQKIRV